MLHITTTIASNKLKNLFFTQSTLLVELAHAVSSYLELKLKLNENNAPVF
jgi:hypothetical protein